jgi:hypothetical protein
MADLNKLVHLITRNLGSALTVERLIEDLETMPPQALDVESIGRLYESGYSNSNVALRENGDERDEDEQETPADMPAVVILSAARY